MIPVPPPSYEQTIEAVAACGVPAANIRIAYAEELQSDVITISDIGGIQTDRLRCVEQAVDPFYITQIEDSLQRRKFRSSAAAGDSRREKAEAIEWLKTIDLLDRVPLYNPAEGVLGFAQSLEAACGLLPGVALEAHGPTELTFRHEFLAGSLASDVEEKLNCLSRMLAASNADEHDIHLMLVGNGAMIDDDQ